MQELKRIESDDIELVYQERGRGPFLFLLHPFPTQGTFWDAIAVELEQRYTLVVPDLRAHGASGTGNGAATMRKHAADLLTLCDKLKVQRAAFIGCSVGGYILFEFMRQHRERVAGLALCNTRAAADSDEQRKVRMQAITDIEKNGPSTYLDDTAKKLVGETTQRNRPDIARHARELMAPSTAASLRAALLGLAERPDARDTLAAITAPTLVLGGGEDTTISRADLDAMHRGIRGSTLEIIPDAGHYAPLEKPELASLLFRKFLDAIAW